MSQPKTTRIPAPLYAAAGAGELAYRQLLKLPLYANDLSDKAVNNGAELREQVVTTTTGLRDRASAALKSANDTAVKLRATEFDVDRLREIAMRNAATFISTAQAAQERAIAVYGQLVARGERVVGNSVVQAADTVNADMATTTTPAAVAAAREIHDADEKAAKQAAAAKKAPVAKKATPVK